MDRPPSNKPHCLPLTTTCGPPNLNPFTLFSSLVSKSFRKPDGFVLKQSGAVSWRCAVFGEMECRDDENGGEGEMFGDTVEECCRECSLSCDTSTLSSEEKQSSDGTEEESESKESAELVGSPVRKSSAGEIIQVEDEKMDKSRPKISDVEMMKERFSKLLLGEDMSGCGKGVCTALAISNAITNLCATLFGQLWRLEPLVPEKKSMWQREMEWILCVSDHIVEMIPSWQTLPDGRKLEVMTCRPRSDLYIDLPALRKLDNMLLEILDSFCDQEFWYVDQGISAADSGGSASFRKPLQRQEEKWWLPVPRVPPNGLHENSRKQLQHKRECANQILKAAMAINSNALAEMEVPDSYLDSLPKNGRESLGDVMHRYITSDQFSADCLLDCLEFSSEHQALEIANRLEASIYMWRQKTTARPKSSTVRSNPRSSWGLVKDKMIDAEKRELFADRAQSLLICLKQRFPGLTQTTLDMSKIQCNKDVGKSILESYSRVLESLAFNIVARIDDLLYVDDLTKHSDQFSSVHPISAISHNRVGTPYSVPVSSTSYATTTCANASFLPSPLLSPVRGERSPFFTRKVYSLGFGVKKALTEYLSGEPKGRNHGNAALEVSAPILIVNHEAMSP